MKTNFTILCLLLILSSPSLCQTVWTVELPTQPAFDPFSTVKDIITTSDDDILVLSRWSEDQDSFIQRYIYLLKYNSQGELLWEKNYNFGHTIPDGFIAGPAGKRILETPNQEILIIGGSLYDGNGNMFLFKTSSQGDSLQLKLFPDSIRGANNFQYHDPSQSILIALVSEPSDTWSIYRFNEDLVFLETVNLGIDCLFGSVIDPNLNTYTSCGVFNDSFKKFNSYGNLLYEEIYDETGNMLVLSTEGYPTAYRYGAIQLNEDLSVRWQKSPDQIKLVQNSSFYEDGWDIIATSDGGVLLGGYANNNSLPLSWASGFLKKLKADGSWEWGYVYDLSNETPMNVVTAIAELSDGYVMGGGSEATGRSWLVKVNKLGTFTSSEEPLSPMILPKLIIYPNPFLDAIQLQSAINEEVQIEVYNIYGKAIYTEQRYFSPPIQSIELTGLPVGTYIIKLHLKKSNQIISKKVVKVQ